jgi:hypothetical protein
LAPEAWIDADSVAILTGWTKGHIYRTARARGWRRQGSRPILFRLSDVLASCEGHKETAVRRHLTAKFSRRTN